MSELKTNLEQILQEKTTKLIPENIKRKVEIFDVTGTDGDAEVEELQAKIIETRQEIVDTRRDLENSAATVTGTGENVTLNQTAEATFKKLGVGGNSIQVQLTGKNLFLPILTEQTTSNNVTCTPNGDGTFTLNGTSNDSGRFNISSTPDKTYFTLEELGFSLNDQGFLNGCPVGGSDLTPTTSYKLFMSGQSGASNINDGGSGAIITANSSNMNGKFYLSIDYASGITFNNLVFKPMIVKGITTATEYEPYVGGQASPNPDYPQEIHNVEAKNKLETSLEMIKSINTTGTWNDNVYTNAGLTLTVNDDLSVILNGTTTSHFSFMLNNLVTLKKGTYILNGINTVNSNALLYIWNSDWNNIVSATNSSEFTINADTLIRTGINISSEKTFDNFVVKAMISEEGGEYSPYNCISVKIQNKNLFDEENATVLHSNTRSTIQYVNNSIKVTAGQTSSSAFVTTKVCDVKYLTNKILTVKAYWQGTNNGHTEIGYCDSDGLNRVSLGVINSSGNSVTITVPDNLENKALILWFYAGGNADGYVNYSNVQVEYGSVATTYAKHEEQTFIFPLGNEKLMLGDYLADDGIHHVRKQVVFDGSENWSIANDYGFGTKYTEESGYIAFRVNINHSWGVKTTTNNGNTFSNIAKVFSWFTLQNTPQIGFCIIRYDDSSTTTLWVAIPRSVASTVLDFKTFLQNRNMIIENEIEDSVYQSNIVPYTLAQQEVYDAMKKAISYEEQTNVSSSDTISPIFTVIAFKDADLAIASLDNRVTLLED